ncbi:MAG: DNA polymerase III subunit beta [Sulfuricellaceae bacterium]|jgi:DNA polymerase-3 subunit beta
MNLIRIEREIFLKPLLAVTGIVEKRHTLPILSNVLISKIDNKLSFIATDLEIQITSDIFYESEGDFSITASAKKMQDICRSLPEGTDIEIEKIQDHRLNIKAGKSKFNLQTLPPEDFPKFSSQSDSTDSIKIPQGTFKSLIHGVMYSMAQQDIRYYLNGLLLVVNGTGIKVVATDGHRLAMASMPLETGIESTEIILPRKTVVELFKLLTDSEELLNIEFANNQVKFSFDQIVLISKVVDGKFPDYNKVVPVSHPNEFIVDRLALLQALQRAAILSNEKFRGVRLVLTQNSLRIICNNSEQEEAQEEIEIDYSGDPLDIGFNVTYLLDVLNNLVVEKVMCSFNDANSSGLITIPGNDDFKYVVMPMRI